MNIRMLHDKQEITSAAVNSHCLPDGSIPVVLSSRTPDLLKEDCQKILDFLERHHHREDITVAGLAQRLLSTRARHPHKLLIRAKNLTEVCEGLRAGSQGREHHLCIRANMSGFPQAHSTIGFVFPGQGSQKPGMGKIYWDTFPVYREKIQEIQEIYSRKLHIDIAQYLLNEHPTDRFGANVVQPAQLAHALGLAHMWKSIGIMPDVTIGHSLGELPAACFAGGITLNDTLMISAIRAHVINDLHLTNFSMAVLGMNRDECEKILTRHSGWAEISVINSPNIIGIAGDEPTINDIVLQAKGLGKFATKINIPFPAHTSFVGKFQGVLRDYFNNNLENYSFLETDIPVVASSIGEIMDQQVDHLEFWHWNLRNKVRFDWGIHKALDVGVTQFIEISDHAVLGLAMMENIAVYGPKYTCSVIGTGSRKEELLTAWSKNIAAVLAYRPHLIEKVCSGLFTSPIPFYPDFPHPAQRAVSVLVESTWGTNNSGHNNQQLESPPNEGNYRPTAVSVSPKVPTTSEKSHTPLTLAHYPLRILSKTWNTCPVPESRMTQENLPTHLVTYQLAIQQNSDSSLWKEQLHSLAKKYGAKIGEAGDIAESSPQNVLLILPSAREVTLGDLQEFDKYLNTMIDTHKVRSLCVVIHKTPSEKKDAWYVPVVEKICEAVLNRAHSEENTFAYTLVLWDGKNHEILEPIVGIGNSKKYDISGDILSIEQWTYELEPQLKELTSVNTMLVLTDSDDFYDDLMRTTEFSYADTIHIVVIPQLHSHSEQNLSSHRQPRSHVHNGMTIHSNTVENIAQFRSLMTELGNVNRAFIVNNSGMGPLWDDHMDSLLSIGEYVSSIPWAAHSSITSITSVFTGMGEELYQSQEAIRATAFHEKIKEASHGIPVSTIVTPMNELFHGSIRFLEESSTPLHKIHHDTQLAAVTLCDVESIINAEGITYVLRTPWNTTSDVLSAVESVMDSSSAPGTGLLAALVSDSSERDNTDFLGNQVDDTISPLAPVSPTVAAKQASVAELTSVSEPTQLLSEDVPAPSAVHVPEKRAWDAPSLLAVIHEQINAVMGEDDIVLDIDNDEPLIGLGIDSVQAIELRTKILEKTSFELPLIDILSGASLNEVVNSLLHESSI